MWIKVKWIGIALILILVLNILMLPINSFILRMIISIIGGIGIGHFCSINYFNERE